MATRVHARLRAVLCQVLHHRRDSAGGRRAGGAPSGRHHLAGLLGEGEKGRTGQRSGDWLPPAGALGGGPWGKRWGLQ